MTPTEVDHLLKYTSKNIYILFFSKQNLYEYTNIVIDYFFKCKMGKNPPIQLDSRAYSG